MSEPLGTFNLSLERNNLDEKTLESMLEIFAKWRKQALGAAHSNILMDLQLRFDAVAESYYLLRKELLS